MNNRKQRNSLLATTDFVTGTATSTLRQLCVVVAVIVCYACDALAQTTFKEGDFTYEVFSYDKTLGVQAYSGSGGKVTIPSSVTYDGTSYSVTRIMHRAFFEKNQLTGISIPETVSEIDVEAFYYCTGLEGEITIKNVTFIGNNAFMGCNNSNLTIKLEELNNAVIGSGAFYDLSSTNISVSGSLSNVDEYAFYNCTNLTGTISIVNATLIGNNAFNNCCNTGFKITTASFNKASIGYGAFENVVGLNAVSGTATSMGEYAFNQCTGLTSIGTLIDGHTNIPRCLFYYCSNLTGTINLSNMESIGEAAFFYCNNSNLKINVTLNNATIGESAFCSSSLKSISGTASSIGSWAFAGLSNVTGGISMDGANEIGSLAFNYFNSPDFTFSAANLVDASIGDEAFTSSTMKSLDLSGTVKSIGREAFKECSTPMGTIMFSGDNTSIGKSAFAECTSANLSVYLYDMKNADLGNYAFSKANAVKQFSGSLYAIGDFAFFNSSCNIE